MSHGRSSSISRFHQPTNSLLHNRSPSSNNIPSFPSNSDSMISPKYFRTPSSSGLIDILKYRLRKLKPLDVVYSLTFSYAFLVFLSGVLGRGYEPPLDLDSLSSHNFDPRVQWGDGKVQANYPSYSDPDTPDDLKHINLPPVKYVKEEGGEAEEEVEEVKPKARLDAKDERLRANPPPAKKQQAFQAPDEMPDSQQKLRPGGKPRADGDDGFGKKRQKLAEEEKKHLLREEEEKRLREYHEDEEHEDEVEEKKVGEKQAFAQRRPADRVAVDHDSNVDPEERDLLEAKAKAQALRFAEAGAGGVRRLPKNSDPEEPTHVTSEDEEEEEGSHLIDIHQPESKGRDSSHDSSPDFVRDSPKDKHLDPQHDAHDHHEDDNLFAATEEDAEDKEEEEEEKENIKPAVLGGVGGRGAPPLVGVRGKQRLGELLGEERGKGAAVVDESGDEEEVALGDDDEERKRA